jgi:hypothetical protein
VLDESSTIREQLEPILGMRPWRARLGWGSFLTFDFGKKVRQDNHWCGTWHIWIQNCKWRLAKGERKIVDSESERHLMENAIRNLENYVLSDFQTQHDAELTLFVFGPDLRLICSPYPDPEPDEDIWTLFAPGQILTVGANHRVELQRPRNTQSEQLPSSTSKHPHSLR